MTFKYKQFYKKGLNIPKTNKCFICGYVQNRFNPEKEFRQLLFHHKDNNPENNARNNLIVLCGSCHKKVHFGNLKIPREKQTTL